MTKTVKFHLQSSHLFFFLFLKVYIHLSILSESKISWPNCLRIYFQIDVDKVWKSQKDKTDHIHSFYWSFFFFLIKKQQPWNNKLWSPKNFPLWHQGYSVNQQACLDHLIKIRGSLGLIHLGAKQKTDEDKYNHKSGIEREEWPEATSRQFYVMRWIYEGKCPRKDKPSPGTWIIFYLGEFGQRLGDKKKDWMSGARWPG